MYFLNILVEQYAYDHNSITMRVMPGLYSWLSKLHNFFCSWHSKYLRANVIDILLMLCNPTPFELKMIIKSSVEILDTSGFSVVVDYGIQNCQRLQPTPLYYLHQHLWLWLGFGLLFQYLFFRHGCAYLSKVQLLLSQ